MSATITRAAEAERPSTEARAGVEHRAHHAGGIQLPPLLKKIKALREARLRAEHVAFSFMKKRVQPLMARDTLGYQYTDNDDTSWMLGFEVEDNVNIERLGKIFKDMPPYTPCPAPEYSTTRLTNQVSSHDISPRVLICLKLSYSHLLVV
jgi:hypothetical protein